MFKYCQTCTALRCSKSILTAFGARKYALRTMPTFSFHSLISLVPEFYKKQNIMDYLELEEQLDHIVRLLSANKEVLTFEEACEYTGISRSYLYKLTASKQIPHPKPNGKIILFEKAKLNIWLLQNRRKSKAEIEKEALEYTFKKR